MKIDNKLFKMLPNSAQCLGEYHCLHAKLSPNSNTVTIHLGAPTPHIEHSCVPPSFDEFVPYLKATLVPSGGVLPVLERCNVFVLESRVHIMFAQ